MWVQLPCYVVSSECLFDVVMANKKDRVDLWMLIIVCSRAICEQDFELSLVPSGSSYAALDENYLPRTTIGLMLESNAKGR